MTETLTPQSATPNIVFLDGRPPHAGWWLTKNVYANAKTAVWRWWSGTHWSVGVKSSEPAYLAGSSAYIRNEQPVAIQWSRYYPKGARVQRMDPRIVR